MYHSLSKMNTNQGLGLWWGLREVPRAQNLRMQSFSDVQMNPSLTNFFKTQIQCIWIMFTFGLTNPCHNILLPIK